MNIEDKNIAIVCITKNGKKLATRIKNCLDESDAYFVKRNKASDSDLSNGKNQQSSLDDKDSIIVVNQSLKEFIPTIFKKYKCILFIMATGIVVRTIAPLIKSKFEDPAILVTDEKGTNMISLLSGHMGDANKLTLHISKLINSNPVITTATDVNNKSSLDMIAKALNGYIYNFRDSVLKINSMLVNNEEVGLFIDGDYNIDTRGFKLCTKEEIENTNVAVVISNKANLEFKNENIIKLVPRDIVIGVGCKKNTDYDHMRNSLIEFLDINNIDINAVSLIGSIDVKKEEDAIIRLAKYLDVDFKIFSADEISTVDFLYDKSEWVKKNVGVYSVAEPCAHLLSNGNLIIKKQKFTGITFSVGRLKI